MSDGQDHTVVLHIEGPGYVSLRGFVDCRHVSTPTYNIGVVDNTSACLGTWALSSLML